MKEILQTELLEYEKSTFLIDVVKHDSQKLYLQIVQTIHHEDGPATQQIIKINPKILKDIISVLFDYSVLIQNPRAFGDISKLNQPRRSVRKKLTEKEKSDIQKRYLKGVSIQDLTLQFDCSAGLIEETLRKRGIAIVKNNLSYSKFRKRNK